MGPAHGMQQESWNREGVGERHPGTTIDSSTERSADKFHGGNKIWKQAQKELQGLVSGGWKLLAGSRHKNRYTGSNAKSLANDNR